LDITSQIDARICELERIGANEVTILIEMVDQMPDFKQLMDTAGQRGMTELCARFDGLYRYPKILENIATGIHSDHIKVPRKA